MVDLKLNSRQNKILLLLEKEPGLDISSIEKSLEEDISRATLNRDLAELVKLNLLSRSGKAKAITYSIATVHKIFQEIDREKYFTLDFDQRNIYETFNQDIFDLLKANIHMIFNAKELEHIHALNKQYLENIKDLSSTLMKKEFERLTIELAWKSSKIEGNTYSLLETETLIKTGIEAKGHAKEEALMLLNHKKALDYMRDEPKHFQKLSPQKIQELHSIIVGNLDVSKGIRSRLVGITGTNYRPLDNQFQIKETLENICEVVNICEEPLTKTLLVNALLAYLQAFEDGNKRTSRLTGNAILMAYNYCPLSYRSIDETEYKKAMILFYEQNNLQYLKELVLEQFEFAVRNYFL